MQRLELVLPVFNERRVLRDTVRRVISYIQAVHLPAGCQVVIADNGSTDGTTALARDLAASYDMVTSISIERRGRGAALKEAWRTSTAEFSLYMDVDLSTDLRAIGDAWSELSAGADIVVGSRVHPHAKTTRCLKREVLSRGYNVLVRLLLSAGAFDDAQCGFKAVRVAAAQKLLPLIKDDEWFFDTELLALAEYAGMKVSSIPVVWLEDADSKVNIFSTVWQDLKGLIRVRRHGRQLVCHLHNEMEYPRDPHMCHSQRTTRQMGAQVHS